MEEMKNEFVGPVTLTEDEVKTVLQYKLKVDQTRADLGTLRIQFLAAEKQILDNMTKADEGLLTHIKTLAEGKGVPVDETCVFDFSTFSFVKRPQQ